MLFAPASDGKVNVVTSPPAVKSIALAPVSRRSSKIPAGEFAPLPRTEKVPATVPRSPASV